MNEAVLEERAEIVGEIFGSYYFNRNNNEVMVFCPEHPHHKRKLSVNIEKNCYKCWVCNYSGKKIHYLLSKHATKDQRKRYLKTLGETIRTYNEPEEKTELTIPEEYVFVLSQKNSPLGRSALNLLYNELNLDDKKIIQNKIGFCAEGIYKDRILFPSFDSEGKLNYFITRKIFSDHGKKYLDCPASKNSIIFNELFLDWSKPIIIVESIKTYLRHFDVPNVIQIMGTKLDERSLLFNEIILRTSKVGFEPTIATFLDEALRFS